MQQQYGSRRCHRTCAESARKGRACYTGAPSSMANQTQTLRRSQRRKSGVLEPGGEQQSLRRASRSTAASTETLESNRSQTSPATGEQGLREALHGVAVHRQLGMDRARATSAALRAAVVSMHRSSNMSRSAMIVARCVGGPWQGFPMLEAVMLGLRKGGVDHLVSRGVISAEVCRSAAMTERCTMWRVSHCWLRPRKSMPPPHGGHARAGPGLAVACCA